MPAAVWVPRASLSPSPTRFHSTLNPAAPVTASHETSSSLVDPLIGTAFKLVTSARGVAVASPARIYIGLSLPGSVPLTETLTSYSVPAVRPVILYPVTRLPAPCVSSTKRGLDFANCQSSAPLLHWTSIESLYR